ncbi:hypothetical protein [Shewanella chilikensis]|nr:hypothetical protein [Shewanella chilikensis]
MFQAEVVEVLPSIGESQVQGRSMARHKFASTAATGETQATG